MPEICPVCGLPKDLCVCEEIAKEEQKIKVYVTKRRFGKLMTVIEGFDTDLIDIKELAKKLKDICIDSLPSYEHCALVLKGQQPKLTSSVSKTQSSVATPKKPVSKPAIKSALVA